MAKLRLYLDTTIFCFLFADDDIQKRDVTHKFFVLLDTIGEIFISPVVTREIEETKDTGRKKQLIDSLNTFQPSVIPIDDEIIWLADKYIDSGIIPKRYYDDALHIATAVVSNLDAILSWNFDHIVKLKTRREINGLSKMLGYKEIEICTPMEVI